MLTVLLPVALIALGALGFAFYELITNAASYGQTVVVITNNGSTTVVVG